MRANIIKSGNAKSVELKNGESGEIIGFITEITSKNVGAEKANKANVILWDRDCVHYHEEAEEQYHCISGSGFIYLNNDVFEFNHGDTVIIPPGIRHAAGTRNSSKLISFTCISSPPYDPQDECRVEPFHNWSIEK